MLINQYAYDKQKKFNPPAFTFKERGLKFADIICPFCDKFFKTLWPISDTGKKCTSCGAIHYRDLIVYPLIKQDDKK